MEHDALNGKLEKLGRKKEKRQQQIDVLDRFIADLKEMRDMPVEFSGSLWNAFVEKLTIYPDGNAEFLFKNGAAITEELQRSKARKGNNPGLFLCFYSRKAGLRA